MKRYLITGFSGFVAYWFLRQLDESCAEEKAEVLGLDLHKPLGFEKDYDFPNLTIRFMSIDLLDRKSLEISLHAF